MAVSSNSPDQEEEPRETSHLLGSVHDEPSKVDTNYVRIIAVVMLSIFLLEIGDYMLRAPSIRLMEDILCRQYYDSQGDASVDLTLPIPEENCKIAPIQEKLAMLRGWDSTFSCIPGIVLAIP